MKNEKNGSADLLQAWIQNIEEPPRRKSLPESTMSPLWHGEHPTTMAVLASWGNRTPGSHAPSHAGSARSKNLSFGGVQPRPAINQPKQQRHSMIVRERAASGRLAEKYRSLSSMMSAKQSSPQRGHPSFSIYSKADWQQGCRHSGQANYHPKTSAQKSSGKTEVMRNRLKLSVDGFAYTPS